MGECRNIQHHILIRGDDLKGTVSIISGDPPCKDGKISDSRRYPRNLFFYNSNAQLIFDININMFHVSVFISSMFRMVMFVYIVYSLFVQRTYVCMYIHSMYLWLYVYSLYVQCIYVFMYIDSMLNVSMSACILTRCSMYLCLYVYWLPV